MTQLLPRRNKLAEYSSLVALSHSIFALPFAFLMIGIVDSISAVHTYQVFLLATCIVTARTAAMAFNRIVDVEIDGANPRTKDREIPSGRVSRVEAFFLVFVSSTIFLFGSYLLGHHCLVCAPAVLLLLFSYSYFKRFSSLCHLILGAALACAPGGVWYALTGRFSWDPVPIMLAVVFWVAGFDIVYSLQDREFDKKMGLHSIPTYLGEWNSRVVSIIFHILCVVLLVVSGVHFKHELLYWIGLAAFSCSIGLQHIDLSRHGVEIIGKSFFVRNGVASIILCVATLLDLYVR